MHSVDRSLGEWGRGGRGKCDGSLEGGMERVRESMGMMTQTLETKSVPISEVSRLVRCPDSRG